MMHITGVSRFMRLASLASSESQRARGRERSGVGSSRELVRYICMRLVLWVICV